MTLLYVLMGLLLTKGLFVLLLIWLYPYVYVEALSVITAWYVWVVFNNTQILLNSPKIP